MPTELTVVHNMDIAMAWQHLEAAPPRVRQPEAGGAWTSAEQVQVGLLYRLTRQTATSERGSFRILSYGSHDVGGDSGSGIMATQQVGAPGIIDGTNNVAPSGLSDQRVRNGLLSHFLGWPLCGLLAQQFLR